MASLKMGFCYPNLRGGRKDTSAPPPLSKMGGGRSPPASGSYVYGQSKSPVNSSMYAVRKSHRVQLHNTNSINLDNCIFAGLCHAKYNTHCYVIFREPMTYDVARSTCQAAGFQLATIDDQAENDAIQHVVHNRKLYHNKI